MARLKITTEEFDRILADVIDQDNPRASNVLAFGGVYEILAEHYNNAVLEAYELEHATDNDGDDE